MTRKTATNRRSQTQKPRSGQGHYEHRVSLSAAAGPVPSRARYSRSAYRNMAQAGRYTDED